MRLLRLLHREARPGLFHEMCATEGVRPSGAGFRPSKVVGTSARSGTGVMEVVGLPGRRPTCVRVGKAEGYLPRSRLIESSRTYSPTSSPVTRATWPAVRKWMPANTRASASSATAAGKPEKDRVTPGIAGDSRANRLPSPKWADSTAVAALPMVECPDEYSGKAGVTSKGDQVRSARRIAVTGRQKL